MNTPFNGDRLKKARIYRGFTVAELAERVGCQRQTLSMYEISKSQPTDKTTVARLAQELDFPVKYFYEHPNASASGTVYFRSLLTTNKKYRSEQIVKMDYLSQIYSLRGLDVIAATNISSTVTNLFNVVFLSMGSASAKMRLPPET